MEGGIFLSHLFYFFLKYFNKNILCVKFNFIFDIINELQFKTGKNMNDISKLVASYLMDDYRIKGTTEEDVEKALSKIFRYHLLDDAQSVLWDKIINESLDIPWIAEQLQSIWDKYNQEILDAQKEDYENR